MTILNKLEVIIMDFSKSKLNQINGTINLFRNIDKFISSIINGNKMKLNIDYDRNKLMSLKSTFNNIKNYYDEIEKIIDNMNIY